MHPLFRSGKVGLYLLVWAPIAYVVSLILVSQGRFSWIASIAIAAPLCLIYAFVCLSAWYPCQALPLRAEQLPRLILAHLSSAIFAGLLWTGLARLLGAGAINPVLPSIFAMGLVLYLLAVSVDYVVLAVESSRRAQAREAEARLLAGEAELRALKAQINPHFLFNSLNSISALTTADPGKAREMCVLLSAFLRQTLGLRDKAVIPLEEELSLVRSYLGIEKVRFGARLQYEEDVEAACANVPVPPLLLQPLVENGIIHGIAQQTESGSIRIAARMSASGEITIVVENSIDPDARATPRTGFGLTSVRKRLFAFYGEQAGFDAGPHDALFRVAMRLPAEDEDL
jgi:two-component system, LytTR family, sensor histidine kinase AlgZ